MVLQRGCCLRRREGRRHLIASLGTVILYTFIPVAAAAVAGGIAAIRPPRLRTISAVQHFAAGVVFAAAAIELLPELLKHSPVPFMYLVAAELLVRAHQQGETALGSALFFVGFLLHLIIAEII